MSSLAEVNPSFPDPTTGSAEQVAAQQQIIKEVPVYYPPELTDCGPVGRVSVIKRGGATVIKNEVYFSGEARQLIDEKILKNTPLLGLKKWWAVRSTVSSIRNSAAEIMDRHPSQLGIFD